jgi:hypothetical protein
MAKKELASHPVSPDPQQLTISTPKPIPLSPSSASSELAPKLFLFKGDKVVSWQNDVFSEVADYSETKDFVHDFTISPDAKYFAYGHGKQTDEGCCGLYTSALNTIAIGSMENLSVSDVGEKNTHAKWHLSWSPDSKYLAYVVNDGIAFEIMDTSNGAVVAKSSGEGTSSVVWLSSEEYSYVQDSKLYIGTLKNPKSKTITDNVSNDLCVFEGPRYVAPPIWSKDGQWVSYYTKDNYVVLNKSGTNKYTAKIGTSGTPGEDICGDYLDISPIGFDRSNNFYYETENNSKVFVIDTKTGNSTPFENLYAGPGALLNNISPELSRFVYRTKNNSSYTINEPSANGTIVCHNEFHDIDGLAGYAENTWSNKNPKTIAIVNSLIKGATISLFDTQACRLLTKVTINDKQGEYSDHFLGLE